MRRSKLKCYDGQIEKHGVGGKQRRVLLAEYLTSKGWKKKQEGEEDGEGENGGGGKKNHF